jgi:hypothetical protein
MYWIYHSVSLERILVFEDDWMQKISKTVLYNNNNNNNNIGIFAYKIVHSFYVLVTVHRNKFLCNKTNQMHQFHKFILA